MAKISKIPIVYLLMIFSCLIGEARAGLSSAIQSDIDLLVDGNQEYYRAIYITAADHGPEQLNKYQETDEYFSNPGVGVVSFHGKETVQQSQYTPTVAYFRWTWAQLEPRERNYNFSLIDDAIRVALQKNQTVAFRVMPVWQTSSPYWLYKKGLRHVEIADGQGSSFPDHNSDIFLDSHQRLVEELGRRYDGHEGIEFVDIGSVGCWGEWNFSCCKDPLKQECKEFYPSEENRKKIIGWYQQSFKRTKLIGLASTEIEYITRNGSGWRGDCLGDFGFFSSTWNLMKDLYEGIATNEIAGGAWRNAPVAFEACHNIGAWREKGFNTQLAFDKALEWHASTINNFSLPVPISIVPQYLDFVKRLGYRFALTSSSMPKSLRRGYGFTVFHSWINRGVAPMYRKARLTFEWRCLTCIKVVTFRQVSSLASQALLPGRRLHGDTFFTPRHIPSGIYSVRVRVAIEETRQRAIRLANEGLSMDGSYPFGTVSID